MCESIQIIEKPDWISWDEIHNVLWNAHAENRKKGVVMRFPSLPGDEIRKFIEGRGKLFCAIADGKVVGTGAIVIKKVWLWFTKYPEEFCYLYFASVLPEYMGKGIYKQINVHREQVCREMGINRLLFDTHEKNTHIQNVLKKNGFKPVDYKFYLDHYNIVMIKWLDGCPYSEHRLKYEFFKRKLKVKTKRVLYKIFNIEKK